MRVHNGFFHIFVHIKPGFQTLYFYLFKFRRLKRFFTDNVNSILGAISLHLMVVIIFLWFKLGEARDEHKETVMIEFNEEVKTPEDKKAETEVPSGHEAVEAPALSAGEIHSIASNVSGKLDDKISTQKYEQEVMKELGISSLKPQSDQSEKPSDDENAVGQTASEKKSASEPYVPNIIRKDNTTVSYFLENRWHSYIYIPTYKCQGGGTVIIDIIIDQNGKVVSATIAENKSTRDNCLLEEAYHSAMTARFNADTKSPAKQLGTITYVFLSQ